MATSVHCINDDCSVRVCIADLLNSSCLYTAGNIKVTVLLEDANKYIKETNRILTLSNDCSIRVNKLFCCHKINLLYTSTVL